MICARNQITFKGFFKDEEHGKQKGTRLRKRDICNAGTISILLKFRIIFITEWC